MRRTSPTQPSSRPKTGIRPATSSGRPAQAVISSWSSRRMRIVVASARSDALGLVDDHPEQLAPVVRGREPAGDPEDRVEPLGELRLEHEAGSGRSPGMPGLHRQGLGDGRDAVGPDDPPDDRAGRRGRPARASWGRPATTRRMRVGRRRDRGARARQDGRTAARPRRVANGPGHDRDDRRPLTARSGPDYTPGALRAPLPRSSDPAPEVSTHPVDDGPSPIGAGRADHPRNPVRPAI